MTGSAMQFARTTDENLAIAPLVRWLDGVRTARLSIRITAASANGCAAGKPATSVGAADAYHDHASPPRIESAVQPLLYVLLASAVLTGQVGRFSNPPDVPQAERQDACSDARSTAMPA
jgi:hypothetical protein